MTMSTNGTHGPSNQDVEQDILTIARSKGRSMIELDWEMALNEDAIREAMKDVPADAPSRARARL